MYSALLADDCELVRCAAVRSEVEGWRNALVELDCVLMFAGADQRRMLRTLAMRRRVIGETIWPAGLLRVEYEEVLEEPGVMSSQERKSLLHSDGAEEMEGQKLNGE